MQNAKRDQDKNKIYSSDVPQNLSQNFMKEIIQELIKAKNFTSNEEIQL